MSSAVIWVVILVCMAISLAISSWAGRRFAGHWPRLAFFVIACAVGAFLYPVLSGLSIGFAAGQLSQHYHAFRDGKLIAIVGIISISLFGAWVLPVVTASRKAA
jgi:tryptophan-rich sensory protein